MNHYFCCCPDSESIATNLAIYFSCGVPAGETEAPTAHLPPWKNQKLSEGTDSRKKPSFSKKNAPRTPPTLENREEEGV